MSSLLVLARLIRFSPRYFVACVLFACAVHGVLPIPLGLVTRAFFDALAGESAGLNAWTAIALLAAIQLAEVCADPIFGNAWNSLQQKSRVLLQRNLMAAILRGYGRYELRQSVGDTLSRFRDEADSMCDGLDALCDLIGRTLFAIVAVAVMWRINVILTLVLCVPLLLSAWVTEVLGTRTMAYRAASRAATNGVTGFLGELLGAHLALTVAGASRNAVARLNAMGEARRKLAVRDSVFDVLLDSFSIHMGHIGVGVVLLLGAHLVADGSFSVGDFALFVVYLDLLVWYPAEIARLVSDLKRIEVAVGRLLALVPGETALSLVASTPGELAAATSTPGGPGVAVAARTAGGPAVAARGASTAGELALPRGASTSGETVQPLECLEVHGLSYVYPNGTVALRDVSFALERGSFTVVTGRIGSGKSTLLQVLLGLLPRTDGEILWNGTPVNDPASFFVPPRSAYTPQVPRLFSTTLHDNLTLGRSVSQDALHRALGQAVLEEDIALLEHGLETVVGPRGVRLSGGQLQRAAAARMFLAEAELLVLDDLSSALDGETEAELWSRLFARGGAVTCLVVSHRRGAVGRANQILPLEAGRVASNGRLAAQR